MSNPDRLQREAQDHAEFLLEDRGETNARAWIIHCANRSSDGFWPRVLEALDDIVQERRIEDERDESADRGDWEFHRDHDQ